MHHSNLHLVRGVDKTFGYKPTYCARLWASIIVALRFPHLPGSSHSPLPRFPVTKAAPGWPIKVEIMEVMLPAELPQ